MREQLRRKELIGDKGYRGVKGLKVGEERGKAEKASDRGFVCKGEVYGAK